MFHIKNPKMLWLDIPDSVKPPFSLICKEKLKLLNKDIGELEVLKSNQIFQIQMIQK